MDSLSGNSVPLYNPRIDKWSDNFTWINDFSIVEGTTLKGKATIELLQLNRKGLVTLRSIACLWCSSYINARLL